VRCAQLLKNNRQRLKKYAVVPDQKIETGRSSSLVNFGIDQENRYLGHTGGISMLDTFNEILCELAKDDVITD
jgi:hypothetical protein